MERQTRKRIIVSDRTLCVCDGRRETPLTFRQRAQIAELLCLSGVDAIELPQITRPREEMVINRTIALAAAETAVKIAVTAEGELQTAYESIREAKHPILQIVLPTSTLQMEYRLHMKAPALLAHAEALCRAAAALTPAVELVAEDASRADAELLQALATRAAAAGAATIVLCDDAGVWLPDEAATAVRLVSDMGLRVLVRPTTHIGLAAADALSALLAGADGVVVGRGDTLLSAVALSDLMETRGDALGLTAHLAMTEIRRDTEEIDRTVGGVGGKRADLAASRISLSADATPAEIAQACTALGYELSDADIAAVAREVAHVAEKKAGIGARELEAIVATTAMQVPSTYHLDNYLVSTGNGIAPMAQLVLKTGDRTLSGVSMGDGPIDAAFRAVEQIIGHHYELDDFEIQAVTEGRGAVGSALVKLRNDGKLYAGQGISTDIIGASVRAYLNALNKIIYEGTEA